MVESNLKMFWRIAFAALSQRITRVLVILLSLLVGASITIAMAAIYFDINSKMTQELRGYGANFYLGSKDGLGLSQQQLDQALALAEPGLVQAAAPYLYATLRAEQQKIALVGLDFKQIAAVEPYWQLQAGNLISVAFDDKNAVIGTSLAKKLELKLGDRLGLLLTNKDGSSRQASLRIKGVVETGDASDNMLMVNLALLQRWTEQPQQMQQVLMQLNADATAVEDYASRIQQQIPGLVAEPIRKISQAEGKILPKIKGLMGLVSLVILVLAVLCVNTTLVASVIERRAEFALHKALGASERQIVKQVLVEMLLIATIAALLGLLLGYALAQLLGEAVFNTAIELRWQVLPLGVVVTIVAALLAAIVPLRRVMQISPARALKGI